MSKPLPFGIIKIFLPNGGVAARITRMTAGTGPGLARRTPPQAPCPAALFAAPAPAIRPNTAPAVSPLPPG
ncbi:MAG: hypothetical protein QOG28_272 [Trebonia sp.]|jgi:hypothetical protein|nr:hypothetical protein [Trebonia sp.]